MSTATITLTPGPNQTIAGLAIDGVPLKVTVAEGFTITEGPDTLTRITATFIIDEFEFIVAES